MSNVYFLSDYKKVSTIKQFPITKLFHGLFETIKKKQDEIKQKKINYLFDISYEYYLDLHLINKENKIELPDFLYKHGSVIHPQAYRETERIMFEIINNNKVNKCYSLAIKKFGKNRKNILKNR